MTLPNYNEIHVISDLHMGGAADFQILRETKRLAAFVDWVAQQRPDGKVALILNGDIIDTLAEDPDVKESYLKVDNAEAVVGRIMADLTFAPVWQALSCLVKIPGRTLVMVLGNHDLELSFPTVQNQIAEYLAGADAAARGRLEFSTMGGGYSCMVGTKRVFCTHGNEVDAWNFNRYEDLARVGRRLNCGRSLEANEWEANAGTRMVRNIMNKIKRQYAWIDLLKPEMEAAVGVLLALDPAQVEKISAIVPVVGEKLKGDGDVDKRLSTEGFTAPAFTDGKVTGPEQFLGPSLLAGLRQGDGNIPKAEELLKKAEAGYKSFNAEADYPDEQPLGTGHYIWDRFTGWFNGISKEEALRRALKDWLAKDRSFLVNDLDDTCQDILASIGTGIDFVVTGHTHLERAIDLKGGRFYFNCGTWIRLLCFTDAMLVDETSFAPVYKVLKEGTMAALDQARFAGKPFVLDQCGAVCIKDEGGTVTGGLFHIEMTATGIKANTIQTFEV